MVNFLWVDKMEHNYNNTFDNIGITTNYMGDTWRSMLMKNCKFYNNVLSRNNDTSLGISFQNLWKQKRIRSICNTLMEMLHLI